MTDFTSETVAEAIERAGGARAYFNEVSGYEIPARPPAVVVETEAVLRRLARGRRTCIAIRTERELHYLPVPLASACDLLDKVQRYRESSGERLEATADGAYLWLDIRREGGE